MYGSVLQIVNLIYFTNGSGIVIISPEILGMFRTLNKDICANRGAAGPRSFCPVKNIDMKKPQDFSITLGKQV